MTCGGAAGSSVRERRARGTATGTHARHHRHRPTMTSYHRRQHGARQRTRERRAARATRREPRTTYDNHDGGRSSVTSRGSRARAPPNLKTRQRPSSPWERVRARERKVPGRGGGRTPCAAATRHGPELRRSPGRAAPRWPERARGTPRARIGRAPTPAARRVRSVAPVAGFAAATRSGVTPAARTTRCGCGYVRGARSIVRCHPNLSAGARELLTESRSIAALDPGRGSDGRGFARTRSAVPNFVRFE